LEAVASHHRNEQVDRVRADIGRCSDGRPAGPDRCRPCESGRPCG
jgi:hypothetical protein